ncbi:cyclin-dependent kinase 9 [Caerostris extrusa]|uniref:Cyclin-dependent kinase 9 n=1 Tax=Caerostris extrusa TaxID=172846 RepID=A0AAV4RLZ2_CAEEX|nr:cyclin-dependent kinase 9 [Caerostris extrusa]
MRASNVGTPITNHLIYGCFSLKKCPKLSRVVSGPFLSGERNRGGWHPENLKCPDVSNYRIISKIGQGSYGFTALREIKILQHLKQENVVNLIEICFSKVACLRFPKTTFYLVLDFCEYDLGRLIYNPKISFTLEDIKTIMKQLLNSLYFIHSSKILHRSPELLLGETNYGPPIDIWAAGCTMAEIFLKNPVMQVIIKEQRAIDLMDRMLCMDPHKRIDSDAALNHDFFWSDPMPNNDLSKTLSSTMSRTESKKVKICEVSRVYSSSYRGSRSIL